MNQCHAPNSNGYCQLTYPCALGRCQYAEQRIHTTTTNGTTVWVRPNEFNCPTCGKPYVSIPRLGIGHLCQPETGGCCNERK